MIKSMTGFSKIEASQDGYNISIELKSVNNRFLEISTKLPKSLTHKEFEIKDLIKNKLNRGSVYILVNIEYDSSIQQFIINNELAEQYFKSLVQLRNKLKIKETVKFEHLLHFSDNFIQKDEKSDSDKEWNIVKPLIQKAVNELDNMRKKEGSQIVKDVKKRINKIEETVEKVDSLGIEKIPQERERLRMRVAQLFESDEIDEHRLQMELVLLADKLDISEECVRLRSHIKFYKEALNSKSDEPVGKKMNFLLQEMNREVNTIGSKCNDVEISKHVVYLKEEIEKIREQIQNIE